MSLRTRLLCLATTLVAIGLLVAGAAVNTALSGYLEGRVDARLETTAQIAARITPPPGIDSPQNVRVLSSFEDTTVSYVDDTGASRNTFDSTTAAPGGGPQLPELDRGAVLDRAGKPFSVPARDDDHSWRVVALTRPDQSIAATDEPTAHGSVIVATSLDEVDRTVDKTRTVSLTTGGILLAVLAVVGRFAVRSGLRPLTRIEETADAIASGDFSHRIAESAGAQTEVGRLTTCLNRMLDQIDTAFRARAEAESRMRRFFADASHELRTPLVGIKGYTDLYRMGASRTRHETDHLMTRIAEESERLTRLVGDMLLLARLDEAAQGPAVGAGPAPAFPLERAPMDLRTLAADALHDVRALDATRPVTLTGPDGGKPATAQTLADEERLRQVVTNLVGNAVAHSPGGTPIRIGVGVRDGLAVLEVADQGPGLAPEERQRVFERFYRADASRSRATGAGAGLGLSIVHSLVTAHGGDIEIDSAPDQGCTFRVRLALLE
ncbi:sensor histidine kinase [Streptomyces alfalfae]|uniref:sensor histidine kinase n=1 Tax=Streptomyces alfalfae TaxID=1642299 RepID=UPI001FD0D473|nr:HAMP domain-containing sensor histidine kinase [Streptomyces alfalfae]